MEARDRLRFLSMEMELQRAWLAGYLDDREARAGRRRDSMLWRTVMSVVKARSVWMAVFGVAAEWWSHRRRRKA